VPVAGGVGDGVRLEQPVERAGVDLDSGGAEVDERVSARLLVAEPGRELERPVAPELRRADFLREHAELRQGAVGAGELDRRAERL